MFTSQEWEIIERLLNAELIKRKEANSTGLLLMKERPIRELLEKVRKM